MKTHAHAHHHAAVSEISFTVLWEGKNDATRRKLIKILEQATTKIDALTARIPAGSDPTYDTDGYRAPTVELVIESTSQAVLRFGESDPQVPAVRLIDEDHEPNPAS